MSAADIEEEIAVMLGRGPQTLDGMWDDLQGWVDSKTRYGIAMHNLERANKIRFRSCDAGHRHDGGCTVELT